MRGKNDWRANLFEEPTGEAGAFARRHRASALICAVQDTKILLLEFTCGLIVVVTPATKASLLPFAFWMFIVELISWVASSVLLLFGADTGMKL